MSSGNAPSFATDVKPLFRAEDRDAMSFAFDLWSYDDVAANADDILEAIENGSMPCDGAWPQEDIAILRSWIESEKQA